MTIKALGIKILYRMGTSIESVNARRGIPSGKFPAYYNREEGPAPTARDMPTQGNAPPGYRANWR
jgi:hypothetical protein